MEEVKKWISELYKEIEIDKEIRQLSLKQFLQLTIFGGIFITFIIVVDPQGLWSFFPFAGYSFVVLLFLWKYKQECRNYLNLKSEKNKKRIESYFKNVFQFNWEEQQEIKRLTNLYGNRQWDAFAEELKYAVDNFENIRNWEFISKLCQEFQIKERMIDNA